MSESKKNAQKLINAACDLMNLRITGEYAPALCLSKIDPDVEDHISKAAHHFAWIDGVAEYSGPNWTIVVMVNTGGDDFIQA